MFTRQYAIIKLLTHFNFIRLITLSEKHKIVVMLALLLALTLAVVILVTCDCTDRVDTSADNVESVAAR